MKRFFSTLLCIAMMLTATALTATALSPEVGNDTWDAVELECLIAQQGQYMHSDMAEDYECYDWPYIEVEVEDDSDFYELAPINSRGFAMAPDLKYAFFGHLNGGGMRGCAMMDLTTGQITDVYYHYETENTMPVSGDCTHFSFAKGIAADDRGYVYVGWALSANYNLVNLGVAHINEEEKTLDEVSLTEVYRYGDPGDPSGQKVGVNGVAVSKQGDKYYCYCVLNYEYDAIYCFDVTDPANPVRNDDFGINGRIEFSEADCTVHPENNTMLDGNYLTVDNDGTIWLCAQFGDGDYGVMKISPEGSMCAASLVTDTSAFCVAHAGSYLLVGDKSGEGVDVYDDMSFEKITTLKVADPDTYGVCYSMIQIIDDIIFVMDGDNNDASSYNALLVAPLTVAASEKLSLMVDRLNGLDVPVDTDAPDPGQDTDAGSDDPTIGIDTDDAAVTGEATVETDAGVATEAGVTETPVESAPAETDTKAASQETAKETDAKTSAPTDASTNAPATGAATAEGQSKTGCSSVMGISSVLALLAVLGFAVKKKQH